MSSFEIALIFMACSVPLVAFLFVLPKFKKKEKPEPTPVKTLEEVKKEEPQPAVKPEPIKEKKTNTALMNNDFTPDDFRGYLNHKQKNTTKPSRVELPMDFMDRTEPYMPRRRRGFDDKPKSVAEEIRSLSPDLKALIIAGVLDKKDFD